MLTQHDHSFLLATLFFPPPPALLPTTTNHAHHCCQPHLSPPPPFITTHKCQWPPMTAPPPWPGKKQRQLPTNEDKCPQMTKWTTAHNYHPPLPTNDSQCPWTDTGNADWWRGTRDNDEGQGTMMMMMMIIIVIIVLYLILWVPLTFLITPQLMCTTINCPPCYPSQWEGPPPHHHTKQNDTKWRGHQMTDNKQLMMMNSEQQQLVFGSLVWSGFLMPQGLNHNHNQSSQFEKCQKTRLNHNRLVFCGYRTGLRLV